MYPLTVVRQIIIASSWENCWRCLTTPAIVSEWFASTTTIEEGQRFVSDFGDGDFFAGRIERIEEPSALRLAWRFWDMGPSYDISYVLSPAGHRTEVSVIDHGSGSVEEVDSLREGWEDFLSRLKRRAETGEPCRYRWNESLGSTCFADDAPALRRRLADLCWWQSRFPNATVRLFTEPAQWRLEFTEAGWGGIVTRARVRFDSHLDRSCLRATHSGWVDLPHETQVAVRREYAGLWRELLASVETEFGLVSAGEYAASRVS